MKASTKFINQEVEIPAATAELRADLLSCQTELNALRRSQASNVPPEGLDQDSVLGNFCGMEESFPVISLYILLVGSLILELHNIIFILGKKRRWPVGS